AYDLALRTSLTLYRRGVLEEDELYPFLYPHAFEDIVMGKALDMGIDPFLVYSLIRQESLFDPWAVSPARAYGLMQLLLPTAQRMAPVAGIDSVELDDLFQPKTNIRLGIAYLKTLSTRFDGSDVLVLARYNAGERAADRWKERLAGLDEDEFIEQISYRETRNYMKKILRNYRNYRRLYGEHGALLSDGSKGSEQTAR
ncbi:MAG: lytic transglycosylase domain-containing protein, partial [Myxococcales bacterium]